jgi:hypothetical protein
VIVVIQLGFVKLKQLVLLAAEFVKVELVVPLELVQLFVAELEQ